MIAVLRTPSRRVFDEAVLVLNALEIPFERASGRAGYEIFVAEEHAPRASRELVEYLSEDPLVPEGLVAPARRGSPWPGAVVYALIAIAVYNLSFSHFLRLEWDQQGMLDAAAVRDGEWWRTVTALTLHTGLGHIVSNLVFGALFGALLAEATGNGLGWAMFVVSGMLGNAANVLVRPGDHYAVGASTAIFGALGALAAHEGARGWTDARDVARRWAPLVGGVVLLGFLGGGGENTDVLAHVTGFVSGLGLGFCAARVRVLRTAGPRLQATCAVLALGLVALAWALALRA